MPTWCNNVIYWSFFCSTCFGRIRPSSGALDVKAYTLHIQQNRHEYGPMYQTMHLLKPINSTSSLIPYERLYIKSLHQENKLIPKQSPDDPNPLFQVVIDPYHPQHDKTSCTAPSKLYTQPTQRLSGPSPIYKLGYVQFIQIFNMDK